MTSRELVKVTFQFTGARVLDRIARLRKDKSIGQFLKECLVNGLVAAEKRQSPRPITLERTRPEFRTVDAAQIADALKEGNRRDPVYREVSRLINLYAPVLAPRARELRPAGTLRLDVRCPIERVAAGLAFRAMKNQAPVTIH